IILHKSPNSRLIPFISCMAIAGKPTEKEQRQITQPGHYIDMTADFVGFARQLLGTGVNTTGDVQVFDPFLERQYLGQEIKLLVGAGSFLGTLQNLQTLKK